jgi:hypothetical protein
VHVISRSEPPFATIARRFAAERHLPPFASTRLTALAAASLPDDGTSDRSSFRRNRNVVSPR